MSLFTDNRAVRNVVGLTLTFSIIVVSVGLTATFGSQQLERVSQAERVENARAGMEAVADGMDRLQQQRSVVAKHELNLADGTLTVVDGPTLRLRSTQNFNRSVTVGGLRLRIGDTEFVYAAGALFRTDDRGNSVLVAPPAMSCTGQRAVVSVVSLRPAESSQFGGESVAVTATAESSRLLYPLNRTGEDSATSAAEANLTVSSPRANAWGQQFRTTGNWSESAALDDTYVCAGVDAVYVRQTNITVAFQG
jgi:hypothetical protein